MFSYALDLTGVLWLAEHKDGTIIHKGPQVNGIKKYELIDRSQLESFSLTFRNKPILTVRPGNRTLVVRFKSWMQTMVLSGETTPLARFWIVALLAKPTSKGTTQKVICEYDPRWKPQHYDIDTDETNIHYLFETGKSQVNTKFGNISPFRSLHLTSQEFKHLMGKEDEKIRGDLIDNS